MTKSILAVDCGSTTTTAILIERVDGEYRLRATGQTPSTFEPPWEDVTLGVQQAIRHIEKTVGRTILSSVGWPMSPQNQANQGIDAFTVVCSAAQPLQVIVAGLMKDITIASAQRAAATTYSHVTKLLSLDAVDGGKHTPEARIQAIKENRADVILLVGGTDHGARQPVLEMARIMSIALQIIHSQAPPTVLYAGNSDLRPEMADILGPVAALKSIDNVRPTLDLENLTPVQAELDKLYIEKKMVQLPGFDKLSNWTQHSILPAGKSFEKLIAYLGQHNRLSVIGANIGSRSTTVAVQPQGKISGLTIRSDAGVGHSLGSLLKKVPIERFHRWLPFDISPGELYDRLLNKSLYPITIPTTTEDLMIEQAVAREALRLVANQAQQGLEDPQWSLVVGAGRTLTGSPQAIDAAMLLIDGLELWGVANLALDRNSLLNTLGSIAAIEPLAAVNVAAQDAFLNLGTVIAPKGHGQPGKLAVRVKVDDGSDEIQDIEVAYGSLEVIKLDPGQTATVEIRPARQFDIGLGQPGRGAITEIEGGLLGIIIDARGRPLRFPKDETERQTQLQQWLTDLGIPHATSDNDR